MKVELIVLFAVGAFAPTFGQQAGSACTVAGILKPGICKVVSDCPSVVRRIQRRQRYTRCGFDGPTEIVCCPTNAPQTTTAAPDFSRISQRKCKEYSESVFEYVSVASTGQQPTSIQLDKCGHKVVPLIVGGTKAKAREFPHMALVGYTLPNNSITWSCGGTLISKDYVLTAGHCLRVDDLGDAKFVRLGDLDIFAENDDARPETFRVARLISHPEYRTSSKYNDIGLLQLDRRVTLSPYVLPGCLPTVFNGPEKQAIASGWGLTQWSGQGSAHLLKVTIDKFSHTQCNETYKDEINRRLANGIRDETQMCAGSNTEMKDTCQGDSGGPLQVFHHNIYCMYDIIGVTSFGIGCAFFAPGIYTRVFPYVNWIERVVWGNN